MKRTEKLLKNEMGDIVGLEIVEIMTKEEAEARYPIVVVDLVDYSLCQVLK